MVFVCLSTIVKKAIITRDIHISERLILSRWVGTLSIYRSHFTPEILPK